jgi:3-hydroxyisobutyrate dehydrogenase-like beta-hydroxyacid dehydrogenase|tara:strand:- start:383 stop:1171 length:789 start_codon:yes stop_codon:yes gene_type:complete
MIGVAGCGRMGKPMLSALRSMGIHAKGFDVVDKDSDWITTNDKRFAVDLSTLITVVRDIDQTENVLFEEQNFIDTAKKLERIIVCSTLSPRYVRKLRARVPKHITLIDAPMSGAQIAAERAELSFMLGGEPTELDDAQMLFASMGKHFHRMGPFGSGMQAKVLNNMLAASHTAMTRMILDWADDAGLDEQALLGLIHTSSGQNWLASGFNEIEFSREGYADDNTIGILVKDVASAIDGAPQDADLSAALIVQKMIRALKPRP